MKSVERTWLGAGQPLEEVGLGCGLSVAGGKTWDHFPSHSEHLRARQPHGVDQRGEFADPVVDIAVDGGILSCRVQILQQNPSYPVLWAAPWCRWLFAVLAVGGFQHMSWCARYLGRLPRASRCHSFLQWLFQGQSLIEPREATLSSCGWRSCCSSSRLWCFLETWHLSMHRASHLHLPSWLQEHGVT